MNFAIQAHIEAPRGQLQEAAAEHVRKVVARRFIASEGTGFAVTQALFSRVDGITSIFCWGATTGTGEVVLKTFEEVDDAEIAAAMEAYNVANPPSED